MNMAALVNSPLPGVDQRDFDDRPISLILEDVERNIAVMGRAAKAYSDREISLSERAESYDELHSLFEAFHQYVDIQLGVIRAVAEALERETSLVSISKLRECKELKPASIFRQASVSGVAAE